MKKKESRFKKILRIIWPYFLTSAALFAVVFFGSTEKLSDKTADLDMNKIIANNSYVTVDQLSEFYTTATVADSVNLSTASVIRNNYESVSLMQDVGQTDSTKVEKPNIVDVSHLARGVISYTVEEGDTIDKLASRYEGVTAQDIRWSNGIKSDAQPEVGKSILIPTSHGIAYEAKDGDTAESLATKYKSNAQQIVLLNDLETTSSIEKGTILLLPNGVLPEEERPDYEAPSARSSRSRSSSSSSSSSSYKYSAAYASGNRYAYGWCTWYAWQWRHNNMPSNYDLPSNMGNAYNWGRAASAAGFKVNKSPAYGAVFVSSRGYYGHVGIVTAVHSDGSITISDMNGVAGWGRVGTTTLTKSEWSAYSFIHGK